MNDSEDQSARRTPLMRANTDFSSMLALENGARQLALEKSPLEELIERGRQLQKELGEAKDGRKVLSPMVVQKSLRRPHPQTLTLERSASAEPSSRRMQRSALPSPALPLTPDAVLPKPVAFFAHTDRPLSSHTRFSGIPTSDQLKDSKVGLAALSGVGMRPEGDLSRNSIIRQQDQPRNDLKLDIRPEDMEPEHGLGLDATHTISPHSMAGFDFGFTKIVTEEPVEIKPLEREDSGIADTFVEPRRPFADTSSGRISPAARSIMSDPPGSPIASRTPDSTTPPVGLGEPASGRSSPQVRADFVRSPNWRNGGDSMRQPNRSMSDSERAFTPPPRQPSGNSERNFGPPPRTGSGHSEHNFGPRPRQGSNHSERTFSPPPRQGSGHSERTFSPPPLQGSGNSERNFGPPPRSAPGNHEQRNLAPQQRQLPNGMERNFGPPPRQLSDNSDYFAPQNRGPGGRGGPGMGRGSGPYGPPPRQLSDNSEFNFGPRGPQGPPGPGGRGGRGGPPQQGQFNGDPRLRKPIMPNGRGHPHQMTGGIRTVSPERMDPRAIPARTDSLNKSSELLKPQQSPHPIRPRSAGSDRQVQRQEPTPTSLSPGGPFSGLPASLMPGHHSGHNIRPSASSIDMRRPSMVDEGLEMLDQPQPQRSPIDAPSLERTDSLPTPTSLSEKPPPLDNSPSISTDDSNGPAPSIIYKRFELPRGKEVRRDSLIFEDVSTNLLGPDTAKKPGSGPTTPSQYTALPPPSPPSPQQSPLRDHQQQQQQQSTATSTTTHARKTSTEEVSDILRRTRERPENSRRPSTAVTQPSASGSLRNNNASAEPATSLSADEHVAKGIDLHEHGELQESSYHFRLAAHANHPTGMLMYALACRHGWGMRKNPREGVQWLRKVTELASAEVAEAEFDSSHVDYFEKKGRKAQFALSIYELGVSHMNGWGIEQDKALALRCFEIAGTMGDADALSEAGYCYANGVGCKKDMKKAAKFYRMAEEKGANMVGQSWIWKDKYLDDNEIRARDLKKAGGKAPEATLVADNKSVKEKGGLFNRKKG